MKTITLLLAFCAFSCGTVKPTPCKAPCPQTANCTTACANGSRLGCIWATPTPAGAPCTAVCENAAQSVPWNVDALTTATTCTP